jgi:hypothetical protein
MSKHGWERGEIKLPSTEAVAFRHDLVNTHNQIQARLFERAQIIYTQLKAAGKGKRNFDFYEEFTKIMQGGVWHISAIDTDGYDELSSALFPYDAKIGREQRKPSVPKKKDFKQAKLSAKGLPVGGEAGIEFKGSTVLWVVAENNHSVERAHDHAMGKAFFRRLAQVKWTNRSGGEIVGNDEYNRDNESSGSGGNYVTMRFGAAETQFKKSFGRKFWSERIN